MSFWKTAVHSLKKREITIHMNFECNWKFSEVVKLITAIIERQGMKENIILMLRDNKNVLLHDAMCPPLASP